MNPLSASYLEIEEISDVSKYQVGLSHTQTLVLGLFCALLR